MNQQSKYITFKSFKRGGIPSELHILILVGLECYGSLVPKRTKVHKMTASFTKKALSKKYLGSYEEQSVGPGLCCDGKATR